MVLCRDVYHCLPSQLRKERYLDIAAHLALIDEEGQIERGRSRRGRTPKSTPRARARTRR